MAGLSSRFKKAGYDLPKYMLSAHGKTLFDHSVESFKNLFKTEHFLFIALDVFNTKDFIESSCIQLGISSYSIVILEAPTRGQAETVYLGLRSLPDKIQDQPITIFNIDTFRPNFTYPLDFDLTAIDGYLETFVGSGKNWSNVVPVELGSNRVALTAEKEELSEFCCTGLYYWASANKFMSLFESLKEKPADSLSGGEYYIAPIYNELIETGADVRFSIVAATDVIFCGIPSEYDSFLKKSSYRTLR